MLLGSIHKQYVRTTPVILEDDGDARGGWGVVVLGGGETEKET